MRNQAASTLIILLALLTTNLTLKAETIYGYSGNDGLFSFESSTPGTLFGVHPVTGIDHPPEL